MATNINTVAIEFESDIFTAIGWAAEGRVEEAQEQLSLHHPYLSPTQTEAIREILLNISTGKPAAHSTEREKIQLIVQTAIKECIPKVGFDVLRTSINFLGDGFKDGSLIQSNDPHKLVKDGILEPQLVPMSYYNDIQELKKFNFQDNGFEYTELNDSLLKSVGQFALDHSYDNQSLLLSDATAFIQSWVKERSIECDDVVPLGLFYRNQNASTLAKIKALPPVYLAHIDFQKKNLPNAFSALKEKWKPHFDLAFGPMSSEDYMKYSEKVCGMVNFWVPLNLLPTQDTLAVMDASTLNPGECLSFLNETPNGSFFSTSFKMNERHHWVASKPVGRGRAIIFNSLETPHTAVSTPIDSSLEYEPVRESFEARFALLKRLPKMIQNNRIKTDVIIG